MFDPSSLTFLTTWFSLYVIIGVGCLVRWGVKRVGYPLLLAGLVLFSLHMLYLSLGFEWAEGEVGAGFLPIILSVLIVVLSIAELSRFFRIDMQERSEERSPQRVRLEIFTIPLLTLVYLFLISHLGYYLSTAIYILVGAILMGSRLLVRSVVVASLWLIFVYLTFDMILKVPLPRGGVW